METFDTNVVLRLVYRDDPGQADSACSAWQEAVASDGIWRRGGRVWEADGAAVFAWGGVFAKDALEVERAHVGG